MNIAENTQLIKIFIGYDYRERAATNVLIDSIYQKASIPVCFIPLVISQLKKQGFYWRERDPKQSTDFSFSRFLVPKLMGYKGWAIFMDCDMLCKVDIKKLWDLRDEQYSVMCVKHDHNPTENIKFLGEIQSNYPKKNWSSLMLFNCEKCKKLTPSYVNKASGLDLHRFNWLKSDSEIGGIPMNWNFLVDVQKSMLNSDPNMLHWTLGGPWFNEQALKGDKFSLEWFRARDNAIKLWD